MVVCERKMKTAKNGVRFIVFRCFRPEDGQKSERWMSLPWEAFQWFRANVRVEEARGRGRAYKFSWPGQTRLRCHGNHDELAAHLREQFGHCYAELDRIPFRREEILGLLNHLRMTPMVTNTNPNPNRDPTPNPARLKKVISIPGVTRLKGYRRVDR